MLKLTISKIKNKSCVFTFLLVSLLTLSFQNLYATPDINPAGQYHNPKYHHQELLIKFRPNVTRAQEVALARSLGNAKIKAFKRPRKLANSRMDRWRVMKLGKNVDIKKMMEKLAKNPTIELIEPNFEISINATPNDPAFTELWGLNNSGQSGGTADADIDAIEAWDTHNGENSNVIVAVIDTGVDYTHEDLAANHWVNPGEIAGNGIDDDGNGYIDDVYGYDFYNLDADPFDGHSHGTHVAGTIAAVGNNGIGVAGVSWGAKIMAVKFLSDSGGGYTSGAISSVLYAADMGARIMSNSWGGGAFSQALEDAIWTAYEANSLFVAAAGNDSSNNDASPYYPSSYDVPNVIAVAATDHNDNLAYFSSYGANTVDLTAPGVDTYSTTPGNSYGIKSGTSMATPHVSGAAALLLSQNPARNTDGLKSLILDTVDTLTSLSGATVTGGRLNVFSAIGCLTNQYSLSVTKPVSNFSVVAGFPSNVTARLSSCGIPVADGVVTVNFDNNDNSITLYDDGVHNDGAANDGVYSGSWIPFTIGPVVITVNSSHATMGNQTTTVNGEVSDQINYSFESTAFNWIDTTAGTAYALSDDGGVTISVGFDFSFYGVSSSNVTISSNGFLTFSDSASAWNYSNTSIPNLSSPNGIAAPFWDDLNPSSGGTISSLIEGTAPNRRLTISWINVPHYSTSGVASFQATLYEGSNDIIYQYLDTVFENTSYDNGQSATVGVEDQAGTNATQISYNQAAISNNSAYKLIAHLPNGNYRPVATHGGPYAVNINDAVIFDGSNSFDPENNPITYLWDFGDDTTASGVQPSHTYTVNGVYTVTLIANDGIANSLPVTTTVTVVGTTAPTIVLPSSYETYLGGDINFDASGSYDPDGDTVYYSWDFGDGTRGTGPKPVHHYYNEGSYIATVTVTDLVNVSQHTTNVTVHPNLNPYSIVTGPDSAHWANTFTLDGTGSYDPDNTGPLTYRWMFEGQEVGTEPTLTYQITTPGRYNFQLVVSDGYRESGYKYQYINITNDVPVANPGGPYNVHWGTPLTFNGSASFDPNGDAVTYRWYFGDGGTSTEINPVHTYQTPGTYTATLYLRDGVSYSTTESTTVTVSNTAPVAEPGGPYSIHWNMPITFNGLLSSDPDADTITSYSWDFGDGTTGTGATPVHSYTAIGTYMVSLVVSDGVTNSLAATTTVTVTNTAPVANAGGPYAVHWGIPVTLDASLSSDPDNDAIQTYSWNFGDGTTGSGAQPVHTYQAPGSYAAQLIVSDSQNDSVAVTTTVEVTNTAPVASIGGPYDALRAQSITISGGVSTDPDGDSITSYLWDFGDGITQTTTTSSVEYIYTNLGTFTITLVVSDGFNQSVPVTTTVVVTNSPPVANAGNRQYFNEDTIGTLDGSASYDIDGTIVIYKWEQTGGKKVKLLSTDQAVVTFKVPRIPKGTWDAGVFRLTVTDNDGAITYSDTSHIFESVD